MSRTVPPRALRVVEVSPRDTLQRAGLFLPLEDKRWACERLREAGFATVEATTFRPDLVPFFPDAEELLRRLDLSLGYRALVYDAEAARRCVEIGVREVVVNVAASARYEGGIGRTHAQALATETEALRLLKERGVWAVASMSASCGDGTPGHGDVLARTLDAVEAGEPDEVVLVDSYSLAEPEAAVERLGELKARFPRTALAVHFHDGAGRAVENTLACARAGAEVVELGLRLRGEAEGGHANADTAEGLAALREAGFGVPEVDLGAVEEVRSRMRERGRRLPPR